MNNTSRYRAPLGSAIAFALASLAGSAAANEVADVDVQPVQPPVLDGPSDTRSAYKPPKPTDTRDRGQPTLIEVQALEDQPLTITLPPEFDGLSIVELPSNGTLLADQKPIRYVPHPDFNGRDVISFGSTKPVLTVEIKVGAVNDPPSFDSLAGRAHAAGAAGLQTVPRWAKAIEAGPGEEAWSQQVWFDAAEVSDPSGVVESLSVSPDGTLSYVLSGQPGIATWTVQALDNGGNLDGGISVTEPRQVRIGVGASADLAIKKVPLELGPVLRSAHSYQLVVSNFGTVDAMAARVVDMLPKEAGTATWRCVGQDGGACPKVAGGKGAVDATIDLPAGSVVVFTVDRVGPPVGDFKHVAFVVPPDYLIDPDLSNNEAGE